MDRPPLISTLFPYTTLFRSIRGGRVQRVRLHEGDGDGTERRERVQGRDHALLYREAGAPRVAGQRRALEAERSEEHTSELQSRENLVCRLLLEKKKIENGFA